MPSVRIAVWSCIRPGRTAPQAASLPVADGDGLARVLLALAGDEGGPSGASGRRPADLGSGAVDAQCDVSGLRAGEHVGQGAQAQAWSLRDGEPASGQQRPDLVKPRA
jgi:hypothetical protein